jgi:nitroreductase
LELSRLDVFKAIKARRSIRAFTDKKVTEKEVGKLIEAARWAPTAGNIQPWEFIVVRDKKIKHGLCEAALNQTFIEEAPVVIVVCADPMRSSKRYGSRGINLYCLQDTAAATQNILLAAHAMELAACWVGAFNEEAAKRVLRVPDELRPIAVVPVGHPAEKPRARPRKHLSEIVHYETFNPK